VRNRITACDDPARITISAGPSCTRVWIGIDQVNLRACRQSAWFRLKCLARTRPWTANQLSERRPPQACQARQFRRRSRWICFCKRRNQRTVSRTCPYCIPEKQIEMREAEGGESSR
jgi:hypothetical protein